MIKEWMALAWHSTDAMLQMKGSSRSARAFWTGIGIGWSAFWLVKHYSERRLVEIKPWSENGR